MMKHALLTLLRIKPNILIGILIGLAVVYLAQSLLYVPSAETLERYSVTAGQAMALKLTITIPYIIIWFIAAWGYKSLWNYTNKITGSKDAVGFQWITLGIFFLVIWLPITNILNNYTTHYYQLHPESIANMVRINNYVHLLLLFPAFSFIYVGSKKLVSILKERVKPLPLTFMIAYIVFCALYTYITLQDPARAAVVQDTQAANYYLPDWLIVTTLIIPRLIMWFLGLWAVYKIYQYTKFVKGTLYKEALRKLALGVTWVVLITIILRLFQTLSVQINQLSLGAILLIVYVILLVLCAGYVLISQGSKRLQRLEEL